VAVPLMCKLDAQLLRTAKRLKMIIQYGVGVEGIDIPEVCMCTLICPCRVKHQCGPQHSSAYCCVRDMWGSYTCNHRTTCSIDDMAYLQRKRQTLKTCVSAGHRARHMGEQHSKLRHRQCSLLCRACHISHDGNFAAAKFHA